MAEFSALAEEGIGSYAKFRYDQYLARRGFIPCESSSCSKAADVYCVDVARYAMSPIQFVAGALQCGADVGFAMFPWHPVMMLKDEGEIPGTGVYFVKDFLAGVLKLRYPDGVCGAEVYSLADWAAWLSEHVVTLGEGKDKVQYNMQLLKRYGPFMITQATRVLNPPDEVSIKHALDLEVGEKMYVVSGWRLKSLASDPDRPDSWDTLDFMVAARIVDAVYEFGLQLSSDDFSRYALRRQLTMYERVTIEGSSVTFGYKPTLDELDFLTTQLYAELFVARYESGRLSKELMMRLSAVAGFSQATVSSRVRLLVSWCLINTWEKTFGRLVDAIDSLVRWFEGFFSHAEITGKPEFQLMSERVDYATMLSTWRKTSRAEYRAAVRSVTCAKRGNVITLRGGLIADMNATLLRARSLVAVPKVLTSVHTMRVALEDGVTSKADRGVFEETDSRTGLVKQLGLLNAMDEAPHGRHIMPTLVALREEDPESFVKPDQDIDPDYIGTMNHVYEAFNPGMNAINLSRDIASLSLDPQDRQLYADKLRIPRIFAAQPKDRAYYISKILALGAPKRQETGPELLSAIANRNLSAPKVSLSQDNKDIIPQIWDNFLRSMCVENAKEKLEGYQKDRVALEENAYKDWISQSRPDVVNRVARELIECDVPLLEQDVGSYLVMLKSDVKPPLSDKPLRSTISPQVIVYHSKGLSSMYSAIFRVLVKRFLSLLRPNVHVNLLKDMGDIKKFLQAVHPFDEELKYVENDFSKYDKSQDAFVFELEQYVFRQLGMNEDLLQRWVVGHEDCRLFSFTTGLSLHLRFQRKSGDATTSFGNVLLNIMSVAYAYQISDYAWALFMGDDSLMAVRAAGVDSSAVQILAEVFNLQAKTFVTVQPYFASWFFMFIKESRRVIGIPDPIKRIEKWSQAVSAEDPQWVERFKSAAETCVSYSNKANTRWLGEMVSQRYVIPKELANMLPAAVYTATICEANFRELYESEPTVIRI